MNIENRMILKSLQTTPGLTVGQLVQLWTPTWNLPQVQAMVDELVCDGTVTAQGGSIRRYVVSNPSPSNAAKPNSMRFSPVTSSGAQHAST